MNLSKWLPKTVEHVWCEPFECMKWVLSPELLVAYRNNRRVFSWLCKELPEHNLQTQTQVGCDLIDLIDRWEVVVAQMFHSWLNDDNSQFWGELSVSLPWLACQVAQPVLVTITGVFWYPTWELWKARHLVGSKPCGLVFVFFQVPRHILHVSAGKLRWRFPRSSDLLPRWPGRDTTRWFNHQANWMTWRLWCLWDETYTEACRHFLF